LVSCPGVLLGSRNCRNQRHQTGQEAVTTDHHSGSNDLQTVFEIFLHVGSGDHLYTGKERGKDGSLRLRQYKNSESAYYLKEGNSGFFFWNISYRYIILHMPNSFFTVKSINASVTSLGLSSTGQYIIAVANGTVHRSTNYGSSFSQTATNINTNSNGCNNIVSSSDGSRFFITGNNVVYASSNYGLSWNSLPTPANFRSLVTNAECSVLIASGNNNNIYTSSDYGANWTLRTPNHPIKLINGTSTDFIVGIGSDNRVYSSSSSSNYTTWNLINSTANFESVAVSDNGQYIYAKVMASGTPTALKISLDGGSTWRTVDVNGWVFNVNCSSNGEAVVLSSAYPSSSGIYSSNDHGTTWTSQIYTSTSGDNWTYVNVSRNGLVGGAGHYAISSIFTFILSAFVPKDVPYVAPGYVEFGAPSFVRFSKTLPLLPAQNKPGTPQIKEFTMRSIFSDNSRVCYKPGSLSYGGVGSVVNGRHKSKHT